MKQRQTESVNLDHIRVVLVEPTHPGNIGSVARAMKTMGLNHLVLVKPKKFPHYEASKLAAGAESVLLDAQVVETALEAVSDCTMVLGTSVRDREVSWPTFDPKISASNVYAHLSDGNKQHRVAVLFGRESSGLTNSEMDLCQAQIRIDANPEYSSLNLANAVQIIAYELRVRLLVSHDGQTQTNSQARSQAATKEQQEGHLQHLQKTMEALDFVKVNPPTVLMRKLTRLYNKADLSIEEIQILRGILSAVEAEIESKASGCKVFGEKS